MTQTRITKSVKCPEQPSPLLPMPIKLLVSIRNGVKNVLTCDDAWKWHAKVLYMGRISPGMGAGGGAGQPTRVLCGLVCRLLFCRTPPRHMLSISLPHSVRHSLCSASITNETRLFFRTFLDFPLPPSLSSLIFCRLIL